MITYNIMELFTNTVSGLALWDITYIVNDEGEVVSDSEVGTAKTMLRGEDFYYYVRARYPHMLFDAYTAKEGNSPTTNLNNAREELHDLFYGWLRMNKYNFARAYESLLVNYRPLENYYREELGGETLEKHKGSMSETATDITQTPTTKTKTAEKVNAYDGGSVDSNEVTTEYLSGNNHTQGNAQGNYTRFKDIDETTFDKDVQTFNERVTRGNIGVTTSQQMAESEIELRTKYFLEGIVSEFCTKFLYAMEVIG